MLGGLLLQNQSASGRMAAVQSRKASSVRSNNSNMRRRSALNQNEASASPKTPQERPATSVVVKHSSPVPPTPSAQEHRR